MICGSIDPQRLLSPISTQPKSLLLLLAKARSLHYSTLETIGRVNLNEIMMSYCRIMDGYVLPCPDHDEGKAQLQRCQECKHNHGFIGASALKWARCQPH